MPRTEAMALITAKLASLDDERVLAVAEIIDDIAADDGSMRPLTARELALIEQSKADFKSGRTLSLDEARARTDAFLVQRRAVRTQ